MMAKIKLTSNHRRLISSLLFILEQKAEQIEHILTQSLENSTYNIYKDLTDEEVDSLLQTCSQLKKAIDETAADLDISKRIIYQRQYINTLQSHLWEHLADAFHDKMTGYGEEIRRNAKKVDPYIQRLSELVDKLSI